MFEKITPEKAGIRSQDVLGFVRFLERNGVVMHNLLLMKGEEIFGEFRWKPFGTDDVHRMYSQTKSFVAIAVGLLEAEGKISIYDPIVKYFPERIDTELPEALKKQTIRDMLTMETTVQPLGRWFTSGDPDRVHYYLNGNGQRGMPGGRIFQYDSAGSQTLGVLVEKLTGMRLLDYLKKKLFDRIGTFRNAEILKTPNGESWGDSAMVCTPRDIASFARLLMNGGRWKGEQLIPEQYVRDATSPQVDNCSNGFITCRSVGYGYQIWMLQNGFWFSGMGGQSTYCIPEKDLICICTGDNQGQESNIDLFVAGMNEFLVDRMGDEPLPENEAAHRALLEETDKLKLFSIPGRADSPFRSVIDGRYYRCGENNMGIRRFALRFSPDGQSGEFYWENAQGEKTLPFTIGDNVLCRFPQLGYSDEAGGVRTTNGFTYRCAVSAAWKEERKFGIKVQIIDRYFGNMYAVFSFGEDGRNVTLAMEKTAEDFLDEYRGMADANRE